MTESEPVLVRERHGMVVVLRLNRPEARNALNPELIDDLGRSLEAAEQDPDVRAVVLTGTGDRAFCAGMDLRAFAGRGSPIAGDPVLPEDTLLTDRTGFARFTRGEITVPIVGAANATAVAGGFELLLNCDVVVASEAASFGFPEVRRGLFAAGGGVFLATRIPLAVALELTLTGDLVDAARAYALGLVNEVVAADQVVPAAVALAERIARNGPLALQATKELVRAAALDPVEARRLQAEWLPRVFGSEDAREGAAAFIERRAPAWKGV
jgi:enoyl-CoA hydratase